MKRFAVWMIVICMLCALLSGCTAEPQDTISVPTTVLPTTEQVDENGLPVGWALDENGHDSDDADRVLKNIIAKTGGGILPLGGSGEMTSGYKGYGFAMLCEIATAILSGGTTSNYIYKTPGRANIAHCFIALDHGMFGDKKEIKERMSTLLRELRESPKADGCDRIYTHGEKEIAAMENMLKNGIPVNENTMVEVEEMCQYLDMDFSAYFGDYRPGDTGFKGNFY